MSVFNRKISLALMTLAILSISTAVNGQGRFETSDIRGKWYGDDGRVYVFQSKSENEVALKIEGQETKAKKTVDPSMDQGVVQITIGPESIVHSQYLGSFRSPLFHVSKNLNTAEGYQPRAVPLPILQEVFSKHRNFRSRIDIEIIDKSRIILTRHVTSVRTRSGKLSGVDEKAGTETAIITRTKQAKRTKDTGDKQNQSGDAPNKPEDGAQDSAKTGDPGVFVCFNGKRYLRVSEGSPCAKSAEKQLAGIDRLIRGLRNLIAKHSDPSSKTVQDAQSEVSRLRKEKAQLLAAIDGDTKVLHEEEKAPAVTLDLTRTTSTEIGGGGVREETRDDKGLVELAREYRSDGSVSFEKSIKQKYSNGRPAQVWEAYYYPETEELQAEIEINYYDPDGNSLYKTKIIQLRDRPDQQKYWVWDKSKNDWTPTDTPPVGF